MKRQRTPRLFPAGNSWEEALMVVARMTKRNRKRESTVAAVPLPPAARPLTNGERSEVAAYEERRRTRLRPPRFGATSGDAPAGTESVSPAAGVDADLFRARLCNALGAVDQFAVGLLLSQAAYVVEGSDAAQQCNSAAALLSGIAPRNEIEGMLAVQMLAAHNLSLSMARRATKTDRVDFMQRYGALSAKLMNVFTRQLEALARLRGQAGKQVVRVEHVTVEGPVTTRDRRRDHRGGRGMRRDNAEQPHAPRARRLLRNGNLQGDPTTAPRCGARTRSGRRARTVCARASALPHAWRRHGQRRARWQPQRVEARRV